MVEQHEVGWLCPHCNKTRKADGVDPCLGKLPGVQFACCGHGQKAGNLSGYIAFENGTLIRFYSLWETNRAA